MVQQAKLEDDGKKPIDIKLEVEKREKKGNELGGEGPVGR